MEKGTAPKVTARDFFIWAGGMISLYATIISLTYLLLAYIDRAFPDKVFGSYSDPYADGIRIAMAFAIVLCPISIILLRFIRKSIEIDASRSKLWVRRWALGLTLFIVGTTGAIDLVMLVNSFLGGELTLPFVLKAGTVLVITGLIFAYFFADLKGYWRENPVRAARIGYVFGILTACSVVGGFFIIGSPTELRRMRFDEQKLNDLATLQWQIVTHWQQKRTLPATLDELEDPISGFTIPLDPQTRTSYGYAVTGEASFNLCAAFNHASIDRGSAYPIERPSGESWQHGAGETCFSRTIDPDRYPPYEKVIR